MPKDLKLEPQLRAIKPMIEEKKPAPPEQKKSIIGPDLGIKPSSPIEMKKPIDIHSVPSAKPLQSLQPAKPLPLPVEKTNKMSMGKTVPQKQEKQVPQKQAKPEEKPKKNKIEIAPKKPIDHINAIPELGR